MSKNMRTACFSLSLSLRQPARPVGRAFLHTATVIVTSLVHQWRPLSFSLSLTHDACCLSWFPFCSSFCHVHCCCYGREREREREGERKIFVRWASKREKERELTSRSLPRSRLLDRNLQNRNWDKSLLWVLSSPWASPNPSFVSAVGWGWARCVGGRVRGWAVGHQAMSNAVQNIHKKGFFRKSSKRFWRQNWATRKLWKWAKNEIGFGTPVTFLSFIRATAFQIPVKFETWRFRPMCQINKIGSFSDSLSGNYELS